MPPTALQHIVFTCALASRAQLSFASDAEKRATLSEVREVASRMAPVTEDTLGFEVWRDGTQVVKQTFEPDYDAVLDHECSGAAAWVELELDWEG